MKKLAGNKKGQALVEYGLVIAGVALISATAISIFGHKVGGMIAATAGVLPGVNRVDNRPIAVGRIVETTGLRQSELDMNAIVNGGNRLGENVGITGRTADFGGLVVEPASGPLN